VNGTMPLRGSRSYQAKKRVLRLRKPKQRTWCAVLRSGGFLEHCLKLFGLVNGTNGLSVLGPVASFEQTGEATPLQERRNRDQLVADRTGLKAAIEAEVREPEQFLACDLIEAGLCKAVEKIASERPR
jgi:hypothetical protein